MTLIHQITDTHIPVTGDMRVSENFLELIAYSKSIGPDLLVLTGDLPGEDGNREVYEWIRASLPADIPHIVIPGNHDDPVALFEVFKGGLNINPDFCEKIALNEIDLVFVNTASTRLPKDQLLFLQNEEIRPDSILFIHHPTREISGGFMDTNYPLLNRDVVDTAIAASQISHVFCGHFHTEFEVHAEYNLYLTASPAFDVDRDSLGPIIGPPRVPLREIVVEGRQVSTKMIYLGKF